MNSSIYPVNKRSLFHALHIFLPFLLDKFTLLGGGGAPSWTFTSPLNSPPPHPHIHPPLIATKKKKKLVPTNKNSNGDAITVVLEYPWLVSLIGWDQYCPVIRSNNGSKTLRCAFALALWGSNNVPATLFCSSVRNLQNKNQKKTKKKKPNEKLRETCREFTALLHLQPKRGSLA